MLSLHYFFFPSCAVKIWIQFGFASENYVGSFLQSGSLGRIEMGGLGMTRTRRVENVGCSLQLDPCSLLPLFRVLIHSSLVLLDCGATELKLENNKRL